MFAETFSFKSDGTYEKLQLAVGSIHPSGGVFFKVTGNWHISVKGTVCLSNSIGNAIYTDGTQDLNYKKSDESYKYTFSKKDGKNGIYGFSISSWFYKKD